MGEDIKQRKKTAATYDDVPKYDDVPNEIKDLVKLGIFTEEEALVKCIKAGLI